MEQRDVGGSTLSARKIWWDEVVSRLNNEGRGKLLGSFKGDDKILTIYSSGHYLLSNFELNKFSDDLVHIRNGILTDLLHVFIGMPQENCFLLRGF